MMVYGLPIQGFLYMERWFIYWIRAQGRASAGKSRLRSLRSWISFFCMWFFLQDNRHPRSILYCRRGVVSLDNWRIVAIKHMVCLTVCVLLSQWFQITDGSVGFWNPRSFIVLVVKITREKRSVRLPKRCVAAYIIKKRGRYSMKN